VAQVSILHESNRANFINVHILSYRIFRAIHLRVSAYSFLKCNNWGNLLYHSGLAKQAIMKILALVRNRITGAHVKVPFVTI